MVAEINCCPALHSANYDFTRWPHGSDAMARLSKKTGHESFATWRGTLKVQNAVSLNSGLGQTLSFKRFNIRLENSRHDHRPRAASEPTRRSRYVCEISVLSNPGEQAGKACPGSPIEVVHFNNTGKVGQAFHHVVSGLNALSNCLLNPDYIAQPSY